MAQHQSKKYLATHILIFLLSFFATTHVHAQALTDSLLHKIIRRFETEDYYKLEAVIQSVNNRKDTLPPDASAACLPGKEMLAVAVFATKPKKLFARMLVTKRYNKKIAYDEHLFQDVAFDESLSVHYALLRIVFPSEANHLNCGVNLQVYDKGNPAAKVWLLVFSK
jgi:hypothetical protein